MITRLTSRLFVGLMLLGAVGCRDADADSPNARASAEPSLTTVLIDRSGSRTPHEIDGDRQLLKDIIEELAFGERIVVLQVHHAGRSDGARRWMSDMPMPVDRHVPTPVDRQSLSRTRSAAALAATELFDSTRPNRTDLIATLFDAADVIRGSQGTRARIIMLSDMMQSTREMDMESGNGASVEEWLRERKRQRLLPDLGGACVVVVGGDLSSETGARVFRFWQDYFAAAGAELKPSNYRYTAMGGRGLRC